MRAVPSSGNICVGELEIRLHEHAVLAHGLEIPLTPREFEIVMMLAEHPGWVFSANQLSGDPEEGDHSPESVSVLVSRLRQKLAAAGVLDAVETVRGFGYRLRSPTESGEEEPGSAGRNRELRDASWQLQEAAIEVEHSGSSEQQQAAVDVLDKARRALYACLAE